MKALLLTLLGLGVLGAIGAPLAAWHVDSHRSVDVQMFAPHAPEVAAMERLLADEDTPVVSLYGEPLGPPTRVVMCDSTSLVSPPEQPGLRLLPVDKQRGENPLQTKTVWFAARWASVGSGAAGLAALMVLLILRHRSRP